MICILPYQSSCLQFCKIFSCHYSGRFTAVFKAVESNALSSKSGSFCSRQFICHRITSVYSAGILSVTHTSQNTAQRFKSQRRRGQRNDGDESEESDEEDLEKSKDFQVLKGHVNSTRVDAVLKFALGMSRNKVDNIFYNSSIYLNGEKVMKKSQTLTIEDEVDVVRDQNRLNPSFLDISRVEVLDVHHSRSNEDKLTIKVRRFKLLTVENYAQPWKPMATDV